MRRTHVPALLAALTASTLAHGAGFAIYEWSPSFNATGGTLIGNPVDAATAFINPAGMTQLPGTHFLLGASAIFPSSTTQVGPYPTDMKSDSFYIPEIYATTQLGDRTWLGFTTTTEFGLGTKYPKGWIGDWSNVKTTIESVTLSPTMAHAITDSLSLGFGPRFIYLDFRNQRNIGAPFSLKGDGWGVGASASLLWKITDTVNFGLTYRSDVKQSVRGTAHSFVPGYTGRAGANVHLPAATTAGLNWQATEKLNLGVSATFTEWSSYDELYIKINELGTPARKDWDNVWRLGIGARYGLTDAVTLMAGYVYDQDPINNDFADYMLPAGNRHILGGGVTYAIDSNWEITLAYSYIYMETEFAYVHAPTGAILPTKYKDSDAHVLSTSIAYKF